MQQASISTIPAWAVKFAQPLRQLCGATLQKVSSLSGLPGVVVRTYSPCTRKRVDILLSAKIGDSGLIPLNLSSLLPPLDKKPHGFVEMIRKYCDRRIIVEAYLTMPALCVVLRFAPVPDYWEDAGVLNQGPDGLVLDLSHKPPRLALVRHFAGVPMRYQNEIEPENIFQPTDLFFESWYEWSLEGAKTKRRLFLKTPLISYCPYEANVIELEDLPFIKETLPKIILQKAATVWDLLPTAIRRLAKTKVQFYQRGLVRRRQDLPSPQEIQNLQNRAQTFRDHLYLWPKGSLVWYVPENLVAEFGLSPIYTLKSGEKPSQLLHKWFDELETLKTRQIELTLRIQETEKQLSRLQGLLNNIHEDIEVHGLLLKDSLGFAKLCQTLGLSVEDSLRGKVPVRQQKKLSHKERPPYTEYKTSQGACLRVARSAHEGDALVRLMPGHHMWIHILNGEGAHVWLEKPKNRNLSPQEIREAGILALHFSRQGRHSQEGEVYVATRANIEKKKHLPPGKVLVRRSEVLFVRYDEDDIKGLLATGGATS